MRRWGSSGLVAVVAVLVFALDVASGAPVAGAVLGLLLLAFAWVLSPVLPPGSVPLAEAVRRSAGDGRPVVYWRAGCMFCLRLRFRLLGAGVAGRVHWVDIWSDPDGAAAVRAITGGDETVPTVVLAEEAWVNPDPALVRRLASAAAR